jgi:branched-chain amino acid transport system substrate-binding protein
MADPLRRALCAGMLAAGVLPAAARAEPGVSDREIVLGQIIDLSGPLAGITPDVVNASKAWFDRVNARGGIHGRQVRVVTLDDGYVPANSVAAARRLIEQEQAFALLNMTGTGNVAAVLPLLAAQDPPMPLFGPITGADSLRGPEQGHVFHIRASYADEAEKIVQHLVTLGIQRIAVVYLDNGFGKDGLAGVEKAMRKRALKIYASAAVRPDAGDVEQAVATLHDTRPEVIVLVTTGRATVEFIKRYNAKRRGMRFYALSVMGTHSTLKALGPDGVGVVVTSVVPFPWNHAHPAAREYREAMKEAGHEGISFGGFESFLNAKAMTEGLRRAGRNLTRARFVAALEGMRKLDLGGFELGYGKGNRQGSRFVELTIIGPGERFTR